MKRLFLPLAFVIAPVTWAQNEGSPSAYTIVYNQCEDPNSRLGATQKQIRGQEATPNSNRVDYAICSNPQVMQKALRDASLPISSNIREYSQGHSYKEWLDGTKRRYKIYCSYDVEAPVLGKSRRPECGVDKVEYTLGDVRADVAAGKVSCDLPTDSYEEKLIAIQCAMDVVDHSRVTPSNASQIKGLKDFLEVVSSQMARSQNVNERFQADRIRQFLAQ